MFMDVVARIVGKTEEVLLVTFLFRFTAEEDLQDALLSGYFH
jgi:hypothetical protein